MHKISFWINNIALLWTLLGMFQIIFNPLPGTNVYAWIYLALLLTSQILVFFRFYKEM
jgi:hypothetical protein